MQPWHCSFCLGALISPAPKPMLFFWCAALWPCIGEARNGEPRRIIKPSIRVAYSGHCDEYFEFIPTGNSPTRLRKKLLLFALYRWVNDVKRDLVASHYKTRAHRSQLTANREGGLCREGDTVLKTICMVGTDWGILNIKVLVGGLFFSR